MYATFLFGRVLAAAAAYLAYIILARPAIGRRDINVTILSSPFLMRVELCA